MSSLHVGLSSAPALPNLHDFQLSAVGQLRHLIRQGKKRLLLVAPTGCHVAGQELLRYDGSLCKVEDIRRGDLLMGPDSQPRKVERLIRGSGRLYRIAPTKGEPFTVNEDHILTLVRTNDGWGKANKIIDISVRDYLAKSRTFKHIHKLFRVPVEFEANKETLPFTPYFMGMALGDGCFRFGGLSVISADGEILAAVISEADALGLPFRQDERKGCQVIYIVGARRQKGVAQIANPAVSILKKLGLFHIRSECKFIPSMYLLASKQSRLELLAGLIDTDGSLSGNNGYDYISKSEVLSRDVAFLARSLGMAAYVKTCRKSCQGGFTGTYYRVSISGDCAVIPCRLARKISKTRKQVKDVLRTGFRVTPAGEGEYFGFTLNGDGRYLMGDFTVTHNSGKSFLAAHMIHAAVNRGKKIGFLVNRRELVKDLCRRLDRIGVEYGIIMGDDPRRKPWLSVHVASVDTLHRREIPDWDLCFIDEAHVGLSPKYLKIIERLEKAVLIGMTATPCLTDGRGLGILYEEMVRCPDTPELIERGYLVQPRVFAPSSPDVSGVKVTAGEFNQKELALAVDKSTITGDIVQHWKRLAGGRPTVSFAVDIEHSRHIVEQFNLAGVVAAHVDGETSDQDRQRIWDGLKSGEIKVCGSVGVVSYGWDCPPVSCAILARPTQSLALHIQQIGRVLRTHESKKDALILDHSGNCLRHGLPDEPREWTLDGAKRRKGANEERALLLRTCKACWGVFSARLDICPHSLPSGELCAAPYMVERSAPEEVEGELEEIKSVARFVCGACKLDIKGAKEGQQCPHYHCSLCLTAVDRDDDSAITQQHLGKPYHTCGTQLEWCRGKSKRAYQVRNLSKNPVVAKLQQEAQDKGYSPGWVFVQLQQMKAVHHGR